MRPGVLNIPHVLNMPGSWIYQSSEYTRVRRGFTKCLNNFWIWLNMLDCVWICLNMPEYTGICVNMHKCAWMLLLYVPPFLYLFYNPFSTWRRDYLFERLQEGRGYGRKEHEAVFLKRQNLIFSIAAGNISFVFCFRLNIFTSKI